MSLKIRVMGTREECDAFAAMIMENVPRDCIRSISGFYPNRRAGTFSAEGRIYLEFERVDRTAADVAICRREAVR